MKDISEKNWEELETSLNDNKRKVKKISHKLKKIEEEREKIKDECSKKLNEYFKEKNILNEENEIKIINAKYWTHLVLISYLNLQKSKIQGLDDWKLLDQNHQILQMEAREKINSDFIEDSDFINYLNAFFEQIPKFVKDSLKLELEEEIESLEIQQI